MLDQLFDKSRSRGIVIIRHEQVYQVHYLALFALLDETRVAFRLVVRIGTHSHTNHVFYLAFVSVAVLVKSQLAHNSSRSSTSLFAD
jgi:hypothetical protein